MQGASVEHVMPGRIRLRFASRRRDTAFFEDLVRMVSADPRVNRVKANPLTGSLLIEHSASPAELVAFAQQIGLALPAEAAPGAARRQRARRIARTLPRASAAGAGLAALALYQGTRGRLLGSAGELLWHALRLAGSRNLGLIGLLVGSALLQTVRGRVLPPASSLVVYAVLVEELLKSSPAAAQVRRIPPHDSAAAPLAPGG